MQIRHYQFGDEQAQAEIYNRAAGQLPGFKPAKAEDIARRYQAAHPDPMSKFYAAVGERVVGYAVCNPNGRISYPWCLPDAQEVRQPLLEAVLASLQHRGHTEAWAAYRADWLPVLDFFQQQAFAQVRQIVNYVAEVKRLPQRPVPPEYVLSPVAPTEVVTPLESGALDWVNPRHKELCASLCVDTILRPDLDLPHGVPSLYTVKSRQDRSVLGFGLVIVHAQYADPTKLDAAMPCFRLGALGTLNERHKRVNGMISVAFTSDDVGDTLLAEAARRLEAAGLTHAAAQVASDQAEALAFHDRYFQRQGAFPILLRRLQPSLLIEQRAWSAPSAN
jgi:hypothetical protein